MTTISPEPSAAQTHNLVTLTFDRPVTQLQVDLLKFELGAAEAVRVPPAALAGYARATHVGFEMSSTPEVGQLLSTLAAAVPEGGRILELGTGVGVGLGWIVHGLRRRDDVGVTSVERDPALARLVEAARWPKWVSIVVGDCWELVAGLGKFELIFVDIPGKETYDLTGPIAALAPGGTLIIDDIAHARDERPERRARLNGVRQLFDHPDLACADLAFSSGVLMAVRRRT